MFCSKCGKEIDENFDFCPHCGNDKNNSDNLQSAEASKFHKVPKCSHCGHVGPWKVGPILRKWDYLITIGLLFFGVIPGLIYIGIVTIIRSNENNREKTCQNCGAQNLFTFEY